MTEDKTHRIAHRFTSSADTESLPARVISTAPLATNDGAHTGTTHPGKRRVHKRDIAAIRTALSDRDMQILKSVADHRFLTVAQIHAFHFADHANQSGLRIAQRVLGRLRKARVLGTLTRRVGGVRAGSSGLVHYVDVVGDRLLRGDDWGTRRRSHEPTATFVAHTLAIADIHVALLVDSRLAHREPPLVELEPRCWRRFPGLGGAKLILKPDLYVETISPLDNNYVDAWFCEVDLGHESIPTLLKKCRDYEAYRRSGTEQANGGGFPLVVWSMSASDPAKAARRRAALQDAITRDRTLRPELFRIIEPHQFTSLIQTGGTP